MGRLTSSLRASFRAAQEAFQETWRDYEEEIAKRYIEKTAKQQEALHESFATLSESDQHFLRSFTNNLLPDEKPSRQDIERFISVIEQLPVEVQFCAMKTVCGACSVFITAPAVSKWIRKNSSEGLALLQK
jgi:ABC-type Zn uptake system ZnuABC Zn-binding protein ZnuA